MTIDDLKTRGLIGWMQPPGPSPVGGIPDHGSNQGLNQLPFAEFRLHIDH